MRLLFKYPSGSESLEIILATKAYESIWKSDGGNIIERFAQYTGLHFQQDEIEVIVHDGQSMSGKDGVPMRLNVRNNTLITKRNALIHELAHRLLFGNRLYAPDDTNPTDNDEIRVLLFQGSVINDLYGEPDYLFWANLDPDQHTFDHLKDLRYVLSMSKEEQRAKIKSIIAAQLKI
ncbi:MAG: hypothetical protein WCO19_04970 [Candidatus Saccharibacteria bacterium]